MLFEIKEIARVLLLELEKWYEGLSNVDVRLMVVRAINKCGKDKWEGVFSIKDNGFFRPWYDKLMVMDFLQPIAYKNILKLMEIMGILQGVYK